MCQGGGGPEGETKGVEKMSEWSDQLKRLTELIRGDIKLMETYARRSDLCSDLDWLYVIFSCIQWHAEQAKWHTKMVKEDK